jgi:hypothetical protein
VKSRLKRPERSHSESSDTEAHCLQKFERLLEAPRNENRRGGGLRKNISNVAVFVSPRSRYACIMLS